MKKINKLFILFFILISFGMTSPINIFADDYDNGTKITLYSNFGSVQIDESELESYLALGWSKTPVKLNNITPLPVTFLRTSLYTGKTDAFDLKQFDIEQFEYLSAEKKIRIHYSIDYDKSGYVYLKLICYDSYGNWLGDVNLNEYMDYIDVPESTTTFAMVCCNEYSSIVSGEFYYCRQIDLYSLDGRMITVYDIQTPIYTSVGWHEAVTMYALDGREITVPPYEVEAYKSVGWYTIEGYLYHKLSDITNSYFESGKYDGAIENINEIEYVFRGTEYEYPVRLMKEKVMDKWRDTTKCPLGYIGYSLGEEYSVPLVEISLRNISYKPVIAFKLKFTCYNIFGEIEKSYYDTFYCDDAYLNTCDTGTFVWKLYGADSVNAVTNVRITEVVFADGTKW